MITLINCFSMNRNYPLHIYRGSRPVASTNEIYNLLRRTPPSSWRSRIVRPGNRRQERAAGLIQRYARGHLARHRGIFHPDYMTELESQIDTEEDEYDEEVRMLRDRLDELQRFHRNRNTRRNRRQRRRLN